MFTREFVRRFVNNINDKLEKSAELLEVKYISDAFTNSTQSTQDTTKFLAPIVDGAFRKTIKQFSLNIKEDAASGHDWIINDEEWEFKSSQNKSAGFTGNKSSTKCSNHILFKYKLNRNKIERCFFATLSLDDLYGSNWKYTDAQNSSWSGLKISVNDCHKVNIVVGNYKHKNKWCEEILEVIDSDFFE